MSKRCLIEKKGAVFIDAGNVRDRTYPKFNRPKAPCQIGYQNRL